MKQKHCEWCDAPFETKISYQIYCSPECREQATKEKIAQRYNIKKRNNKNRKIGSASLVAASYQFIMTTSSAENV